MRESRPRRVEPRRIAAHDHDEQRRCLVQIDAAVVRFQGRASLERSFITLDDAQLLVACLAQVEGVTGSLGRTSPVRRVGCDWSMRRGGSRLLCAACASKSGGAREVGSGAGERRAGDDSRAMLHRATEISAGNSALRESDSHAQRGEYAWPVKLATHRFGLDCRASRAR